MASAYALPLAPETPTTIFRTAVRFTVRDGEPLKVAAAIDDKREAMPNAEPQEAPAPSRALAGFVRDALVYASARGLDAETRLLDSPYSGVPRDDARALIIAARERERPADAIAAKRVPLSHDAAQAAYRFTVALAAIERALRAQGTTAAEVVAEIAIAFALEERSTPAELATLAAVRAVAETFDRTRAAADAPWEAEALVAALEEAPALQPRAPRRRGRPRRWGRSNRR